MVQIKSEKYTPLLKAYLTYARTPEVASVLLTERYDYRYTVQLSGTTISEHRVNKGLWDAIKRKGGNVLKEKIRHFDGRKQIFEVPVVIRPFTEPIKQTEHIRIRITAESAMDLFTKISKIKDGLEKWGIKPTLCVWEKFTELQVIEINSVPFIEGNKTKKYESIIQSLQVDVAELKEQGIKKAIKEDKKVMMGILK